MKCGLTQEIRVVRECDSDYPEALRQIQDRPPVINVVGRWPVPKEALFIGIVGARRATPYGLDAAKRLSADLSARGVVTVSGMAAGVDAAAHRATLDAGGWTIGVLGHGFGYQYPRENKDLFERMKQEGTLVTEFAYDAAPLSKHFPQRNRIISGLSHGVVVVEAADKSGALITASYAAHQGRDVFAVPGSLFQWQAHGSNRLIKEGAKLVDCAEDILTEYTLSVPQPAQPKAPDMELPEEEKALYEHIQMNPLTVDEMVELTGKSVDRLAELLLSLELKGRISMMPGQQYVTRN